MSPLTEVIPPCVRCGTHAGPLAATGRPGRIDGSHVGSPGKNCLRCYQNALHARQRSRPPVVSPYVRPEKVKGFDAQTVRRYEALKAAPDSAAKRQATAAMDRLCRMRGSIQCDGYVYTWNVYAEAVYREPAAGTSPSRQPSPSRVTGPKAAVGR